MDDAIAFEVQSSPRTVLSNYVGENLCKILIELKTSQA
jgi:hypothetical protein